MLIGTVTLLSTDGNTDEYKVYTSDKGMYFQYESKFHTKLQHFNDICKENKRLVIQHFMGESKPKTERM